MSSFSNIWCKYPCSSSCGNTTHTVVWTDLRMDTLSVLSAGDIQAQSPYYGYMYVHTVDWRQCALLPKGGSQLQPCRAQALHTSEWTLHLLGTPVLSQTSTITTIRGQRVLFLGTCSMTMGEAFEKCRLGKPVYRNRASYLLVISVTLISELWLYIPGQLWISLLDSLVHSQ